MCTYDTVQCATPLIACACVVAIERTADAKTALPIWHRTTMQNFAWHSLLLIIRLVAAICKHISKHIRSICYVRANINI